MVVPCNKVDNYEACTESQDNLNFIYYPHTCTEIEMLFTEYEILLNKDQQCS